MMSLPRGGARSTRDRSHGSRGEVCACDMAACRCHARAAPRELWGARAGVRSPQAHKGGGRGTVWRGRREPRRPGVGRTGRTPRLLGSGPMPHGMEPRPPVVRRRRRPPTALSWPGVDGRRFPLAPDDEPLVGPRGAGPGGRRTGAPARAGWPITGAVLQLGHPRVRERGPPRHACGCRDPGPRASPPGTPGHCHIAWHRPLPPSMIGRGEMVHDQP
jgi:hypothetical protein